MPKSRGRKDDKENWFLVAAHEAENTKKAKLVAKLRADRDAELKRIETSIAAMGSASMKSTAALREAAATFTAVGSGARPAYEPGGIPSDGTWGRTERHPAPPRPITAEQGLNAIIAAVAGAGDADAVMKAGGEWMTRVTNKITEAIRNADTEE